MYFHPLLALFTFQQHLKKKKLELTIFHCPRAYPVLFIYKFNNSYCTQNTQHTHTFEYLVVKFFCFAVGDHAEEK